MRYNKVNLLLRIHGVMFQQRQLKCFHTLIFLNSTGTDGLTLDTMSACALMGMFLVQNVAADVGAARCKKALVPWTSAPDVFVVEVRSSLGREWSDE